MENNFNLTGDEARLFLRMMLSQSTTFRGNELLALFSLYSRLQEISLVQPPAGVFQEVNQ